MNPKKLKSSDPKTGAILRVVEKARKANPLNDPLNELEEGDGEAEEWNGFSMVPGRLGDEEETVNPVVRQLEEAARNGARKAPRGQSQREMEWCERLVHKYGEDYGKMSRDKKLNPMQQTEMDIRKRVIKWKKTQENGGSKPWVG